MMSQPASARREKKRCIRLLIALSTASLFMGCYKPTDTMPTMADVMAEQLPDQESWFTRFDVLEGEQPRMQIYADYIAKYDQADSTYMVLSGHPDSLESRVVAYIFDEKGDSSATIVADEMTYFENDRRFESRGNVIVTTNDNKRLETEHLIWLEVEREVNTTGFVRITTPKEHIQGYDLTADEDLENYEISRVTGQSIVDDL